MEFPFDVTKVLPVGDDGIAILNAKDYYTKPSIYPSYSTQKQSHSPSETQLVQILDRMGTASSKAQGLKAVITDYSKFVSSDHRLYLKVDSKFVLGLLKVGYKNLFHHNSLGKITEMRPLCVLDFYVHESVQRMGVGKELFEKMLLVENSEPHLIAYDRPSPKLIGFLAKHYGLRNYIPQNNNFVIFNEYFELNGPTSDGKSSRLKKPGYVSKEPDYMTKEPDYMTKNSGYVSKESNIQPEIYKERPQYENYPPSRGGTRQEGTKFTEDMDQNAQFQQLKQIYGLNKQKQQQTNDPIFHGYDSAWADPAVQKYAQSLSQNTNTDFKKIPRDERNLIDIQEKLKRTEEDIEKCKQKIEELSKQKVGGVEIKSVAGQEVDATGRGKFKQRVQDLNNSSTPWATHHNIVTQPSSSAYGSYLKKY